MSAGWSKVTRDRTFYGVLLVSAIAVIALVWPFVEVLVLASVVAAVLIEPHRRLSARLGGRRHLAAGLLVLVLAVLVGLPAVLISIRAVKQGISAVNGAVVWFNSTAFDVWLASVQQSTVYLWVQSLTPDVDLEVSALAPLRSAATSTLATLGSVLPSVVSSLVVGVIHAMLFLAAVVTFLADGPALVKFVEPLVPLDELYQRRLLSVFRRFAVSLAIGSALTATAQGTLAAIGFAVVGLPHPLLWGVATAIAAFVPLVGTSLVIFPAALFVAWTSGWPWALGLVLYAVFGVGLADNLVRPLVLSGAAKVHPMLIFLAVFGGVWWMGMVGLFAGPIVVAFFLALATIHTDDFRREEV